MEDFRRRIDTTLPTAGSLNLEGNVVTGVRLEEELKKQRIKDLKQDRKERKRYADKIFEFVCIYLFAVALLLFLSGTKSCPFMLSDTVLLMILGTTTANVIATFYFVANYLFPNKLL